MARTKATPANCSKCNFKGSIYAKNRAGFTFNTCKEHKPYDKRGRNK